MVSVLLLLKGEIARTNMNDVHGLLCSVVGDCADGWCDGDGGLGNQSEVYINDNI